MCNCGDDLASDLLIGAAAIALFIYGDAKYARTVFYLWERKRMAGCFQHGSRLAARKSTILATIWAEECKSFTPRVKQLVELRLMLKAFVELLEADMLDPIVARSLATDIIGILDVALPRE